MRVFLSSNRLLAFLDSTGLDLPDINLIIWSSFHCGMTEKSNKRADNLLYVHIGFAY
jgi:hypothetical protein